MEVIRQAIAEDAASLAQLDEASDDWPWPAPRISSACAGTGGQSVFLLELELELETKPVAYVAFASVLDEGSIYRIAVHPVHRQAGMGSRLLDAALLQLREQGACRIFLELRSSNAAAHALYSSRGFSTDTKRKGYYPGAQGREDALLMSLAW
ncbi:MAG: ribosomal-protein-alanine N-acetyltransferase [Bacteroidia bacterium]